MVVVQDGPESTCDPGPGVHSFHGTRSINPNSQSLS